MRSTCQAPEPLMTPQEVASLLKVSIKTVYRFKETWGGIYLSPRLLRFRGDVINGMLSGGEGLAIRVPATGPEIYPERIQNEGGGCSRTRSTQERGQDPNPHRHGL